MLRHEFDKHCKDIDKDYLPESVTSEMYRIIETVYNAYPTISNEDGKHEIAYLYITFGFIIIQDMYDRAKESERLNDKIIRASNYLVKLRDEQNQLLSGLATKSDNEGEWIYVQ